MDINHGNYALKLINQTWKLTTEIMHGNYIWKLTIEIIHGN